MKLDGIHHITAITRNARENLDFYAGVLGLRLTGKAVNQDDPTHYHLYYSDEVGSPGSGLTFFEYRDALPGIAGPGMAHRIVWARRQRRGARLLGRAADGGLCQRRA